MEVKISSKAKEDLEKLDEKYRKNIESYLFELSDSPLSHELVGPVFENHRGQEINFWRMKIKESDLDHRAFFDIRDNTVVVSAIMHRDNCYSSEFYEEIKERSKN